MAGCEMASPCHLFVAGMGEKDCPHHVAPRKGAGASAGTSIALIHSPRSDFMANFTVNTGVTDAAAKTVGNNDIGTIQGTLSDTTDITINNSGSISATTRGIDTSGSFSTGSFTLNNNAGAKLISQNNDAFRINTNITNGTITVNNSGLLVSGAVDALGHVIAHASGQALDFAAIVSPNAVINITNNTGATIGASGDDAIRP